MQKDPSIQNRSARHDYEILESLEAGLALIVRQCDRRPANELLFAAFADGPSRRIFIRAECLRPPLPPHIRNHVPPEWRGYLYVETHPGTFHPDNGPELPGHRPV